MRVYQFKDLFGNFGSISMLKSSILNDSVPNFILMSGESGTGKSSSAEILALSLTCTNRTTEEPCLVCDSCKRNMLALQDRGISNSVKKVNLGLKNNKEDVDKLISEVFRLERTEGKTVFILEEVHSLDESRQTSLLEEIDKLDKNVYVILCTTRPMKLLEELKNRAITFKFSNLKSSDSKLLLEKVLSNHNVTLPSDVKNLILKKSKGTPRVIVSLTDFFLKNKVSYASLLEFLGEIDSNLFMIMFQSTNDLNSYYVCLQDLINSNSLVEVIYSMKNYLMDLQFISRGVTTHHSHLGKYDKKLAESLGSAKLFKIQSLIHSLPYKCSEADFLFVMLKVRQVICSDEPRPSDNPEPSVVMPSGNVTPPITPSGEGLGSSGVFSSNAIENHLKAESKRNLHRASTETVLTELNPSKIKEILGK